MSIATPGGDDLCDHCDRPGKPYEHRGVTFPGLHANRGERLCPDCLGRAAAVDGVNILVVNRAGTSAVVVNTTRDRDLIAPWNPEGVDGRDLTRHTRRTQKG